MSDQAVLASPLASNDGVHGWNNIIRCEKILAMLSLADRRPRADSGGAQPRRSPPEPPHTAGPLAGHKDDSDVGLGATVDQGSPLGGLMA